MNESRDNDPSNDAEQTAPESLVRALRDRKTLSGRVPAETDREILRRAHAQLAQLRADSPAMHPSEKKLVPFPGVWVRLAAAAAVVLMGVFLWLRQTSSDRSAQISIEQPTVVDAFLLARKVESGEFIPDTFDLNGDGRVNETDAVMLAQRAVKLPAGGAL